MVCCVICGEWVESPGRDRLDICDGCWPNFAGAQPPIGWDDPPPPPQNALSARDALAAYVDSSAQLTPRQVQWLRMMTERAFPAEDDAP